MSSTGLDQLSCGSHFESPQLQALTSEQKLRLTAILDQYLRSLESGLPASAEQLIGENPDLAAPLAVYLDGLEKMHQAAAGFSPPALEDSSLDADAGELRQRLGDFAIVREIGRGGMGIVYEALQLSLGRRVALKVLPFASMLDARQTARFKNEAHAAAQLHHPHIVPVYAVGVERGVHYYAMQLIDGQPLDRAVRELAPVDERGSGATRHYANYFRSVVELGIQAAEALHAAHSAGIVHRDIKPSNLLLDSAGKLWITDFGLARRCADPSLTNSGDVIGTRRYMSPEQSLAQPALVDERTDVYSLGVTLYELLTLRPAVACGEQRSADREPARPRQLQPRLPRDLETVVLKAMAWSKEDRYLTAQELADELRCVLEGKPTAARPPSVPDRLAKWVRRHSRAATAIAAAGLLAMVGLSTGMLLISRQKLRADQNFERAERYFRQAEGTVDRFGAHLAERLAEVPGAGPVRRELLQETLRYYQQFVQQASSDPSLRADLALTYNKIGTVADEMGSFDEAVDAHSQALQLFEKLAKTQPTEVEYRRRAGICQSNLAMALGRLGRRDAARQAIEQAVSRQAALVEQFPGVTRYVLDLALSCNNQGLLESDDDPQHASDAFQRAIDLYSQCAQPGNFEGDALRGLAAAYNNLAALSRHNDPQASAKLYQQAADQLRRLVAAAPQTLRFQADLAQTLCNLGSAQTRAELPRDAAASYCNAIQLQRELVRVAPLQVPYQRDLAISHNSLGLLQKKLGELADAERSFRSAIATQEQLLRDVPQDPETRSAAGGAYNNLGMVLEDLKRLVDAADCYRRAIEHQLAAHTRRPDVERYRSFLSKHYFNCGCVLRQLGQGDQAVQMAIARKELWPGDAKRLFSVAQELARTSRTLAGRSGIGVSEQQCNDLVIATLEEALAAGLDLPANLDGQADFASLARHPRFQRLVRR